MYISTLAVSLLTVAGTVIAAGNATISNRCKEDVYLTVTRQSGSTTQQLLPINGTYEEALAGQGNSLGVTKSADYYSNTTAKLIWGYSLDDTSNKVYFSVSMVNGDPLDTGAGEGFELVTNGDEDCPDVTTLDGAVHVCQSSDDFDLLLCD